MGSNVWDSVKGTGSNVWESVKGSASKVWDSVKGMGSNVWDNLKTSGLNVFNNLLNIIRNIKTEIATIRIPDYKMDVKIVYHDPGNPVPSSMTMTVYVQYVEMHAIGGIIPHATGGIIPHATGGIFNKPTLTTIKGISHMFGEAGREAVLPLDSYTGWMDEIAEKVEKRMSNNGEDGHLSFEQALVDFYMGYMEPVMTRMDSNMQRQADKDEQTVVKIGDKDIMDAYNRQVKRDGYSFTR